MRGMTKMMLAGIQEPRMYPDTEGSEEYNPNNPITIGSMDHYGRNYCIPPHDYLYDCAFYMANNEDMFVTRKTLMQCNGGVWSMDCVSTKRLMYKNWLDKDVYNFYVAEGFPMAKVSTQWYMIPADNKGPLESANGNVVINFPPGTVIHSDNFIGPKNDGVRGQDGRGDTHERLFIGYGLQDANGNITQLTGDARFTGNRNDFTGDPKDLLGAQIVPIILNSGGGELGNPLEIKNLHTNGEARLYATPAHRTGFDLQAEWGAANAKQ